MQAAYLTLHWGYQVKDDNNLLSVLGTPEASPEKDLIMQNRLDTMCWHLRSCGGTNKNSRPNVSNS